MTKEKIKRLEEAGWKVGTVAELLGLTEEENDTIEAMVKAFDDGFKAGYDKRNEELREEFSYLKHEFPND